MCRIVQWIPEKTKKTKILTGPWSSRSGLPTRQSKTTLDPWCAQISVLFRPMNSFGFWFSLESSLTRMKLTGSTIDSLVDNSLEFPYKRSIPEHENTENKKSFWLFRCPKSYSDNLETFFKAQKHFFKTVEVESGSNRWNEHWTETTE